MFETVEELASTVTGVLSPDGPLGSLTSTLTNALDSVWAEFFSSPTPPGDTHWNAYTHEQLYQMLWGEDADVGDVAGVADEWGRHSEALTASADALRSQGDALRSNWQGRAAEVAADRLAELSDRVWNVGARAGTVQKAASDAGDALAVARTNMPPPPPDPVTLMSSAVGAGPMPPLNAVIIGGARIFTGDAVAGAQKAEAVRVMQTYEESLRASSHQVVPPQPGDTDARSYGVDDPGYTSPASAGGGGLTGGGTGGGVPWSRLTGGGAGGTGNAPSPGALTGAGPGGVQSVLAAENAALSNAAAKRGAGGPMGMYPPMGRGMGGDDDKRRTNRLPNVENGLFSLDERTSSSVIGELTDRERNIGL
ncbi:WXG100 family type VII secretion target [Labedaea rhizosphaerae]|uniref:PPE family protein n=1 Tax=Labedaea rhizosphaerae TaxID=598644 RepID=A0A4R6S7H7_LABRH|nr:hypothetical protein [Labedaea rhizosphaerae]TDP94776.1 hypothetical protein EV186_1058 [Labedaea rhizosphaerae]